MALLSYGLNLSELAKRARYVEKYLEKRLKMGGKSIARTDGKIFIGHGRSVVWRDLKDFIHDRLKLPWEEFNREPTAGMSTKERLEDMLDASVFAFLVMTAEDEHADGSKHARANVIHEVGLFQGRLGFERAIVLLGRMAARGDSRTSSASSRSGSRRGTCRPSSRRSGACSNARRSSGETDAPWQPPSEN